MFKASIIVVSMLILWVNPAFAQPVGDAQTPVAEQPSQDSETTDEIAAKTQAEAQFQKAMQLFESKDYEKALSALDHAWRLDENALYLYQRIKVLQAMEEHEFALELLQNNKETLQKTEGVDDLFVVEEQLKTAIQAKKKPDDPGPGPPAPTRTTLNTVGPIALGVVGLGLGGWAAYIFTAECEIEASNGDCLQGESPNTGLGIAASVGAAGAIVGAIVWWIAGAPDEHRATIAPTSNGIMVRF